VQKLQEQIKVSKSIVVIGGGATGTELAAELKTWHPDKSVTLFHSGQHLVGETFKPSFYAKVYM
jgi:NADH dehydrogenase FAD-containing subunit